MDRTRRRRSTRLSLSGMLQDVREIVQKHPNRQNPEHESAFVSSPTERLDTSEDMPDSRGRTRARKEKGAIARLGEALGIDMDDDDTDDDDPSWKEFKPGEFCCLTLDEAILSRIQVHITILSLLLCPPTYRRALQQTMLMYSTN